jgi:hypothetical protein
VEDLFTYCKERELAGDSQISFHIEAHDGLISIYHYSAQPGWSITVFADYPRQGRVMKNYSFDNFEEAFQKFRELTS